MIDWEQESREAAPVVVAADEQLRRIADLAAVQIDLERSIEETTRDLNALGKRLRQVAEVDLPGALDEAGVQSFTTRDGRVVTVKESLYMSIPKSRKDSCARWLQEHGLASLVKEDVVVRFERGEEKRVAALQDVLEREGYQEWSVAESMNTSSVKSALTELMAEGTDVPLELFGGYIRRASVVK